MFSLILLPVLLLSADAQEGPKTETPGGDGDATIRGKVGSTEIVITTTSRLAGAIDSLRFNGEEFIDSFDHGRQLQSAASFDAGSNQPFWAESYNPTEAGSRADGTGQRSTSRLLSLEAAGAELTAKTQMAFWLAPGEKSEGRPALNRQKLSGHMLSKRVRIGYKDLANVIEFDVTFTIPAGERHRIGQFEALTGYMPPKFSKFWTFRPDSGQLAELDDGPGEQRWPVVLAQERGDYAMGVFSPDQPSPGYADLGYGRFRFPEAKVVKWNCVFRERSREAIPTGDHRFRVFVAVGTLDDVQKSLKALAEEFKR
jgi:hypothetical protein